MSDTSSISFAEYLAQFLCARKGFQPGLPPEAQALEEGAVATLHEASFGLCLSVVFDREAVPHRVFQHPLDELLAIGKACLQYTGKFNGQKLPVAIVVYEVDRAAPSEADKQRMIAMQRRMPGLAKVTVRFVHVDTSAKKLWTTAPFGGGLGLGWLRKLVSEPRVSPEELAPLPLPASAHRRPWATYAIVAVLIAMFVVEQVASLAGASSKEGLGPLGVESRILLALGGMNTSFVLEQREWWRLLTASLLHADAIHLLLNGVSLVLGGMLVERWLGAAWLLTIFACGAVGGSLLGLALNDPALVSIGASGAIMGVLAAALIVSYRLPPGHDRTRAQMRVLQFLVPSLIPLATRHSGEAVDYAAHFGGAIAGALLGAVALRAWKREDVPLRRSTMIAAVAAVALYVAGEVRVKLGYVDFAIAAALGTLLIDETLIPTDPNERVLGVDTWGKDFPRDPRVRLFRAYDRIDKGNHADALAELQGALADKEILDTYFADRQMEAAVRVALADLLLKLGRKAEAAAAAQPACGLGVGGTVPEDLAPLGLCQ